MDAEITVIGAGVIGLAIAEELSASGSGTFIIEKHRTFGQETSSRNSEVIHAGIYYPRNSLKSTLCLKGKTLLNEFCKKFEVPYRNCGKLIVATTDEEEVQLTEIVNNASLNGLSDLRIISGDEIEELEPRVFALKAIWSPSTGIIDTHSLMKQLETNFLNNGGQAVYGSEVRGISKIKGGFEVTLADADKQEFKFSTRFLVNSAGLTADLIAEMAGIHDKTLKIRFCKGQYFRVNPPANRMINRLIYPVPYKNMEGIGVHATIDLAGGVRLGPDVTWMDTNVADYHVDETRHEAFYESARKYLPFLEPGDLTPDMAGIRPKIQVPGGPQADFYIAEESGRGLPGLVNLAGMESPGLTASLAIAKYVKVLLKI